MRWAAMAVLFLRAMEAQTAPTLRSETRVVQIDVTVRDAHGRAVEDLVKGDFTVRDEGKMRTIEIFSVNRGEAEAVPAKSVLPPNVFSNRLPGPGAASMHATVILLDTFNDYFDNYGRSREQVVKLIQGLRPDERVAIYVLSQFRGLIILQDYTTDHALLLRNLMAYLPSGMIPAPVSPGLSGDRLPKGPASEREFFMRSGVESVRTAMEAIARHMAIVPGRKSLLWISQGFPPRKIRETADSWAKTIDTLNEANVELDAVDSNGLAGPPRRWGAGATDSMQELAERTGGKAYYNRNDLDAAMAEAMEQKRRSYTLGFYLGDSERDGRFHRLTVQVDRPHLDLHYRQGYIAGTDRRTEQSRKEVLESALLSPLDVTEIGITMRAEAIPGKPKGILRLQTVLDPATISLVDKNGRWEGRFEQMFIELDRDGKAIGRISDSRRFELNAAQHERFEREGLTYSQTVPCENGTAKVHAVIRDSATGRIGSLTIDLQQP